MKFSVPSFALGMLIAAVTIAYLYWPTAIVAAPPAVSDNCTLEGTVNGIDTYFCYGDKGPDYMTTSVGVSVPVE